MNDCVFCNIVHGKAPGNIVFETLHSIVFVPINPYVPGHVLVVPRDHIDDATGESTLVAEVFKDAATYLRNLGTEGNIITSVGPSATQTVFHMHVHVLPRSKYDGLDNDWPWMRGYNK